MLKSAKYVLILTSALSLSGTAAAQVVPMTKDQQAETYIEAYAQGVKGQRAIPRAYYPWTNSFDQYARKNGYTEDYVARNYVSNGTSLILKSDDKLTVDVIQMLGESLGSYIEDDKLSSRQWNSAYGIYGRLGGKMSLADFQIKVTEVATGKQNQP